MLKRKTKKRKITHTKTQHCLIRIQGEANKVLQVYLAHKYMILILKFTNVKKRQRKKEKEKTNLNE